MCFLDHLQNSVEDITDYYRQQGICSGQDCDRFKEQVRLANGHVVLNVL